jgi:drug/metabolite transporter (DMT)-like permease
MVGLHLTSPVFVVAWLAARGGERIGLVLVKLGLIAGAIVLVASGLEEHHSESSALMGSILALGSALAVAVLIVSVSQRAPEQEPAVGAALQLSVATAVMLPLLALDPPSMLDLGQLAIAGAVLLAPGFVLYWRALRELHAQAAGVIGLNEAVVASLVGFVVYGAAFATRTLLAGVLVCAAVGLELRRSTNLGVTSS